MKLIIKMTILLSVILTTACKKDHNNVPPSRKIERNYQFAQGSIAQNVLESYLSRAITQAEFLVTDGGYADKADDARMLKNIGAKFIGRAIYSWGAEQRFNNPAFFSGAKARIAEMQSADPDLVFQAAIFEIITPEVNTIPVPSWVLEAFGQPVATRNFVYNSMINLKGLEVGIWDLGGGNFGSAPDISRLETRMYFYFLARKYIETGIEALHFGQAEMMAMEDKNNNYAGWSDLLSRVRLLAKSIARRGTVICDAHLPGGGILVSGKLLFDFVSFPLRIKEISGEPPKGELQKFFLDAMYGRTKGGITPSGWSCARCPYLVEFDNYGTSDHPGIGSITDLWVWGYDEISWFSMQPEAYRNEFLQYVDNWVLKVDPLGFVQMPGSRVVVPGTAQVYIYRANTNSAACTTGKNQEETIKSIWANQQ